MKRLNFITFFLLNVFLLLFTVGSADEIQKETYIYSKLCPCFDSCGCRPFRANYRSPLQFSDRPDHPHMSADIIWHEFIMRYVQALEASPLGINRTEETKEVFDERPYLRTYVQYVDRVAFLKKRVEGGRNFTERQSLYSSRNDKPDVRQEFLDANNRRAIEALKILDTIPGIILPIYRELLEECYNNKKHRGYETFYFYEKGLLAYLEGKIDDSLEEIQKLIDSSIQNGNENKLTSQVYLRYGELQLEVGLYNEAIESLTKAITKNPRNKEAYFQRAAAYFETGDVEKSLEDYINSSQRAPIPTAYVPDGFCSAFCNSVLQGVQDGATEFIPSLCNTAYGMGECLWAFGEHPVASMNELAYISYEMGENLVDFIGTVDKEKIKGCVKEVRDLYENFSSLNNHDKGTAVGYIIGKYGVDIFAGSAALKGVKTFTSLKRANRICNFESMRLSQTSKELVTSKAIAHQVERSDFFKNSKIQWDRQNKHIPGKHNFASGKSVLEHANPQDLLVKFAGKGTSVQGKIGQPGYRERVDFKTHIGVWKSEQGLEQATTKGIIHYSKNGAHIVPAQP